MDVPESVIDILTSLRDYLQDKCEPPIYVSDRRFMKAIQMLQVVAHADGRTQVRICRDSILMMVFKSRVTQTTFFLLSGFEANTVYVFPRFMNMMHFCWSTFLVTDRMMRKRSRALSWKPLLLILDCSSQHWCSWVCLGEHVKC